MIDLLLINGYLISMNEKREIITDGAVAIDGGKILDVGKTEKLKSKYEATKTIDCKDHVIMPGFVDAHAHGGHAGLKTVIKDTSYWMPAMTHTYKHYLTDDYWYLDGRLSALERLHAGVTTGVSVLGSQPRCDDPIFALNHSKGYSESGLKEIVCTGPCSIPWPHRFSRIVNGERVMKEVSYEQVLESLEYVIEKLNNSNNGKTRAFVAPFGLVTSTDPSGVTAADRLRLTEHDKRQSKDMRRIAEKYNTRLHTDAFGGMVHLAIQDENALLGPDVHLHHCMGLSIDEAIILAETGTSVSFSALELKQFRMRTPVVELLEMGVNVAIGSDGSMLTSSFDMFSSMKRGQMIHRVASNDDFYLPSQKILEMVTIDAAKCIGLDDEIGSLEIGKKADVITLDLMKAHLMPRFNIVDTIVANGSHADIDMVIVDGEILMEDYKIDHLDERKIMIEIEEEMIETVKRAGLENLAYPKTEQWGRTKMYFDEVRFDIEANRKDGGYY